MRPIFYGRAGLVYHTLLGSGTNVLQQPKALALMTNENALSVMKLFKRTKKVSFDAPRSLVARRPLRVYMPDEEIPQPGKPSRSKPTIMEDFRQIGSPPRDPGEKTHDDILRDVMGGIMNNPKSKRIAVEGERVIEEALKAGLRLEKLFVLKSIKEIPSGLKPSIDNSIVDTFKVTLKQMKIWSSVSTPPGLIGVFLKPNPGDLFKSHQLSDRLPLTVVCDNLREPGNLGSILRSAAGAGCKRALLSIGCTDPWDSKVLRGGCGAHFQIPILTGIHMANIGSFIEFEQSSLKSNANDVAQEDEEKEDQKKESFKSVGVFLADSNPENMRSKLPFLSYTDVDYRQFDEIYLVVGGETEGLSGTTLQITNTLLEEEKEKVGGLGRKRRTLARLHIPLQSHVESLNVANAFGIIAFEIRRQFQANATTIVDSFPKTFSS